METTTRKYLKQMENRDDVKEPVKEIFFSDENIKRIQRELRNEVLRKTGIRLEGDQNETSLRKVMFMAYDGFQHGDPKFPKRNVKRLNRSLIDCIIPDMVSNLEQHYGYIKEINQPLDPLPRPINVNSAGRNALRSPTTVWGF